VPNRVKVWKNPHSNNPLKGASNNALTVVNQAIGNNAIGCITEQDLKELNIAKIFEKIGEVTIPQGKIGIGTVCAFTIFGNLLLFSGFSVHQYNLD
jgi:repressor of nif and glnA expression